MAISLATYQTWLDEALTARHQLMLGKSAVEVRSGEDAVRFTQGDKDKLDAYIAQLESKIANYSTRTASIPSPIYPRF